MSRISYVVLDAGSGPSKIHAYKGGPLHISDKYVKCDRFTCPVFFYKIRLLEEDDCVSEVMRYIYEYECRMGHKKFSPTFKKEDGKFKKKYLVLKTNDVVSGFPTDLLYSDEELKYDVETDNLIFESYEANLLGEKEKKEDIRDRFFVRLVPVLIDEYKESCNNILMLFCDKHEYDFEDARDMWVAGDIGTICYIGDMFVDLQDMIYDLKNDIHPDIFEKWYWKCVDTYTLGDTVINYKTFCMNIDNEIPKCTDHEKPTLMQIVSKDPVIYKWTCAKCNTKVVEVEGDYTLVNVRK